MRRRPSFAVSLAAAATLALAAAAAQGGKRPPPRRGEALPEAPARSGQTGGLAVLSSPLSAEVLIPAGQFQMGSPPSEVLEAIALCRRESPGGVCDLPLERETVFFRQELGLEGLLQNEFVLHPVTLSAFWIDRREVTVGEYARCIEAGPCARPPYSQGAQRFDRPELPVTLVSWEDARTYCAWRGARLPTEAEWERAARGLRGRRFPWGNEFNRMVANHGSLQPVILRRMADKLRFARLATDGRDGQAELSPPGSFPSGRTPEGIDDMAGNVAEWVADTFDVRYEAVSAVNPKGPSAGASPFRSVRGGSYLHGSPWMRGAARMMAPPEERATWLGFRCARDGS